MGYSSVVEHLPNVQDPGFNPSIGCVGVEWRGGIISFYLKDNKAKRIIVFVHQFFLFWFSLLQRNDIAMAITKFDQFDFLIDIVPRDELKPPKRQVSRENMLSCHLQGMGTLLSRASPTLPRHLLLLFLRSSPDHPRHSFYSFVGTFNSVPLGWCCSESERF